jgi:hypothetical protein
LCQILSSLLVSGLSLHRDCIALFIFETGSWFAARAGLKLTILLALPPECWDYRCASHAQLGLYFRTTVMMSFPCPDSSMAPIISGRNVKVLIWIHGALCHLLHHLPSLIPPLHCPSCSLGSSHTSLIPVPQMPGHSAASGPLHRTRVFPWHIHVARPLAFFKYLLRCLFVWM